MCCPLRSSEFVSGPEPRRDARFEVSREEGPCQPAEEGLDEDMLVRRPSRGCCTGGDAPAGEVPTPGIVILEVKDVASAGAETGTAFITERLPLMATELEAAWDKGC
jgi:hypothetical protein